MIVTTKDLTIEMTAEEALAVLPWLTTQQPRQIAGGEQDGRYGRHGGGRGREARQGHGENKHRGEGRRHGMRAGRGKRPGHEMGEERGGRRGRRMGRGYRHEPARSSEPGESANLVQLRRMRMRRRRMAMMRRAHRRGLRRGYRMGWQHGLQTGRRQGRMAARRRFMQQSELDGKRMGYAGRHGARYGIGKRSGQGASARGRWHGGGRGAGYRATYGGRDDRHGRPTNDYL